MSTQKESQLEMRSQFVSFYSGVIFLVFSGLALIIGYRLQPLGFGGWGDAEAGRVKSFCGGQLVG